MICPACRRDMIVVEHSHIELDYCPGCQGVWFDAGELELLFAAAGFADSTAPPASIFNSSEVKSTEKQRKCPICRRKMGKIAIAEEPAIIIDRCRRGDGLWFDGGELHQLVGRLAEPAGTKVNPQQQIRTFLQTVFRAKE